MTILGAILLLFLLSTCGILYLWWFDGKARRGKEIHSSCYFYCDRCQRTFVPRQPVSITRCPMCNRTCYRRRNSP